MVLKSPVREKAIDIFNWVILTITVNVFEKKYVKQR